MRIETCLTVGLGPLSFEARRWAVPRGRRASGARSGAARRPGGRDAARPARPHGSWVARSHAIMAAAKRLGHSNANVTTRHYAREVDDRDAEIAASFGPTEASLGARGGHEAAERDHVGGSEHSP
jgi:integrase